MSNASIRNYYSNYETEKNKRHIKHGTQFSLWPYCTKNSQTAFNLNFMRDVVSLSDKEMVALLDGKGD